MPPYKHMGQRGELGLYYEDDKVAIDVTEYDRFPAHPDTEIREHRDGSSSEMFLHYTEIPDFIQALRWMHHGLRQKYPQKELGTGETL